MSRKQKEEIRNPLGCWSSVLGHLGVFSSFGCPALGVCLLPGEGLAAGLKILILLINFLHPEMLGQIHFTYLAPFV